MRDTILIAVVSAMTPGGFLAFIQFLITRHDNRKGIGKTLKKLEKDGLRTQLLLLILMKPEEETEILKIGERYFRKPPAGLDGNWYMTSIFSKWCKERKLEPDWFDFGTETE